MVIATKNKLQKSSILFGIAIVTLLSGYLRFSDLGADRYFEDSIKQAGVAYASCRVVNASVSVVKESSLHLEPAGIGVSLAVGQALDPIDDMTERLSDVMVLALASLGVQKLLFELSQTLAPPLLSLCLVLMALLVWVNHPFGRIASCQLVQIGAFVLMAWLCLPISALVNRALHGAYFEHKIDKATAELAINSVELERLGQVSLPEVDGLMGTINNSAAFLKQKAIELNRALAVTVHQMGDIVESLLDLFFLYLAVFIVQVLALPIFACFILMQLWKTCFGAFEFWPKV